MMRLVHYYPRALIGDGGPTRAMWDWARETRGAGCDVAVLYDADRDAVSAFRDPATAIVPVPHTGTGGIRIPRALGAVLTPNDVLVLHSVYNPGNIAAAWSARRAGVPYIVMAHGGYNTRARQRRRRRKQIWQPVERAYLEGALAVHVFFESETHDVAEIAPNARWIISATGYELPAQTWDGGSGGYIGWLGRYDIETKGLDLLVHAMGRLPASARRQLRTHGKPSEDSLDDLTTIARDAGLEDRVSIGGALSEADKAPFFCQAAAYVHPSRWESHSIGLVEALAYGTPSVVSARCSIAHELDAAGAAVVVDPTPDGIANGIVSVLRRPHEYSERATSFVGTRLRWNTIIADYLRQIEAVRGGREAPHRFRSARHLLRTR